MEKVMKAITTTLTRAKQLSLCMLLILMTSYQGALGYANAEGDTQETTVPANAEPAVEAPAPIPVPDPAPTSTQEPIPVQAQTGPIAPTGAEAPKYTYNPETGKWESEKYIWDPVTKKTAPKNETTYSFNPGTGRWDTTAWVYDAPTGTYKENVKAVAEPPQGVARTALINDIADDIGTTGPDSTNMLNSNNQNNGAFSLFYNANISNNVASTGRSGNVFLGQNTLAGSAQSGDVSVNATILNLLQSAWNLGGGDYAVFTANINGDVRGDITIDPGQLPTSQLAVNNRSTVTDLEVNAVNNVSLNNNIDLIAESGSATIDSNTKAGNATTGDTRAMANVFNLVNSMISSGDSFIGTININGTLDGDILFPPGFLESVLAQNNPQLSESTGADAYDVNLNNVSNTNINNNVNIDAGSGSATVDGNTRAGSGTSGAVDTSVTILNMTGRQVVGDNALLVFVNVMGRWVGMIMDAPVGTTSAAVGGGTTQNTVSAVRADLNLEDNVDINNNINIRSQSGDAAIINNTEAGSAMSGNATAAVNIANIAGSQFSLSKWFGVLFINIFGTWMGSFGVNTAAGNPVSTPSTGPTGSVANPTVQVFRISSSTPQETPAPLARNSAPLSPETAPVVVEKIAETTAVLGASGNIPPSSDKKGMNVAMTILVTGGIATALGLLFKQGQMFFMRRRTI